MDVLKYGRSLSPAQIIVYSFALFILAGTALLMLPAATVDGAGATFTDALFTIVSAVCVTGLSVQDTGTYWTFFGQAVILFAIQVGGLGVVTAAISLTVFSGRKIGLMQRNTMQEALAAPQLKGIVQLVLFILKYVAIIELVGTLLLYTVFAPQYGWVTGWWYAMFHAISAFCNAGFDIMGPAGGGSLTTYEFNPVVNTVIMLLIIIGGLGFMTWADVRTHGFHIRAYRLQSKIILIMTAVLIIVPTLIFYATEFGQNHNTMYLFPAMFQAVTTRTAGFNSVDLMTLSESNRAILILLMLVGGAPGSTAGGIKTTTAFALLASVWAMMRRSSDISCFGRRISEDTLHKATVLFMMYLLLIIFSTIFISALDDFSILDSCFETVSAIATVGLSIGITDQLSTLSKYILIFLMFFGRVGALTFVFAVHSKFDGTRSHYVKEDVVIG